MLPGHPGGPCRSGRGQHPDHNLGAYRIDAANYCPVPLVISTGGYGIFLYEDDGESLDCQRGAFSITRIVCDDGDARTTVRVNAPRGRYAVKHRGYEFSVHVTRVPRAVTVNGRPAREVAPSGQPPAGGGAAWAYDAAQHVVWAWTDPGGKALTAVVTIEKYAGVLPPLS